MWHLRDGCELNGYSVCVCVPLSDNAIDCFRMPTKSTWKMRGKDAYGVPSNTNTQAADKAPSLITAQHQKSFIQSACAATTAAAA